MQQTIKPLGIATNPSDFDCPDGELAASFNIINEDGALRPLPQPVATNITLDSGDEIRCIHASSTFKHYIATNGSTLAWYDNGGNRQSIALPATIHKVTPVGNTLAVLTDSGLCYLLWKYDNTNNATYTNLGSKPPFLELQFGVSAQKSVRFGQYQKTSLFTNYTTDELDDLAAYFTHRTGGHPFLNVGDTNFAWTQIRENGQEEVTNAVWALINSANAKVSEQGYFYAPFFVRFCYRLYDGTTFMHSAPVFIPVVSPFPYQVGFVGMSNPTTGDYFKLSQFVYYFNSVALTYKCSAGLLNDLKQWSDIVRSVDIFVSLPLPREDTSKKITSAHTDNSGEQIRYANNVLAAHTSWEQYTFSGYPAANMNTIFDIPMLYTETEYWDKIKATSDFYKIASYDLTDTDTNICLRTGTDNDHPDGFYEVNIRTGILSTLATQEAMTDDYHSHNDVLPTIEDNRCITSLFNYNNRLSIAAPTERLFKGFSLETMLPAASNTPQFSDIRAIVVHIRTEQGIKFVVYRYDNPLSSVSLLLISSLPLFYPDNRAFAMDVYITHPNQQPQGFRLPMKQHPLLNGATTNGALITSLTYMPVINPRTVGNIPTPNDTITTLNQIRTSEVDNPFYYPAINYKRVGVGTILALSTSAKALSHGQFGQHPLYAFCTDGVWALGVDTTDGTFVPAQPFTRDVCSNSDSILQLDSTVLFPTDRGIMLVSGSQTQCITEKLDYPHFDLDLLPSFLFHSPRGAVIDPIPMRTYIKDCKMIYDYRNQRVVVFNTAHPYAYVYSLKSGLWAMMQADFVATLNAYPHAMAVKSSGELVNFLDLSDPSNPSNPPAQFYVTRPFKLGSNEHKTITALVQHGMIEDRQHVRLILYGSHDLIHWHVVGSSTTNTLRGLSGTPYTAFRLAVIANLTATESLSDFSVQFTPKHTRVMK